ncbi:MAG: hypothetical protein V4628_17945 [Pseudomonadota bacterium]
MRNPAIALLWQCWRLTRRWYVLLMVIAIAIHLKVMTGIPPNAPADALQFFRDVLATRASMWSFMLACLTTLIVLTVSGRAGFPLRFEYRLPINLKLLAGIPLLYLSVACASFYVVPALLSQLFFNVSMPLSAPTILIAVCVATLAAASWSTTGTVTRTFAVIAACFGLIQLYVWLHALTPMPVGGTNPRPVSNISLTFMDYSLVVVLLVVLFGFIVRNLSRQRCNESLFPSAIFARKVTAHQTSAQHSHDGTTVAAALPDKHGGNFFDKIGDAFNVPCPVSSAWSAELWFELKRCGIGVLLLGVLLALSIPLLLLFAKLIGMENRGNLACVPVAAVFFVGIGIAFINRRQDSSGYMNTFEGTRGIGTLQLAGIQFLVAGVTTFAGVVLTSTSLWLSLPLLDAPGVVIGKVQALLAAPGTDSVVAHASEFLAAFTLYITLIAFLVCLHACSVFWGRRVLYGMTIFVIYCIIFIFNVIRGAAGLEALQQHMWAFAGAVLLLTIFMLGRVLYMKTLSLSGGITSLVGWGIFLLCAWISLHSRGIQLMNQAPELLAFNSALLTLPFTFFLLTAWSYDRLRHR